MAISTVEKDLEGIIREEVAKQIANGFGQLKGEFETRLEKLEKNAQEDIVSMVVFSNDMDRILAAYVIALGALGMGMKVSMYFTFWGMAAVKKGTTLGGKGFKQKMVNIMTPARQEELSLSKMNFAGMGPAMFKTLMKEKGVASLQEMREMAQEMGARMIGCSMAMDVMGIREDEFIPGVEVGGVATFLEDALKSRVTLFL